MFSPSVFAEGKDTSLIKERDDVGIVPYDGDQIHVGVDALGDPEIFLTSMGKNI